MVLVLFYLAALCSGVAESFIFIQSIFAFIVASHTTLSSFVQDLVVVCLSFKEYNK